MTADPDQVEWNEAKAITDAAQDMARRMAKIARKHGLSDEDFLIASVAATGSLFRIAGGLNVFSMLAFPKLAQSFTDYAMRKEAAQGTSTVPPNKLN